jgi:hypothetical protein
MDALQRSLKATTEVGSIEVVVDIMRFKSLPGHPDKLFLAMATIEKALNR